MKAAPAARSWIAAGVRYELLMRAMPALRHDMTGPISIMRMALVLLRRETGDAEAGLARVAFLDEQMTELVKNIRSLRDWELTSADDAITRTQLVAQCAGLLRAAFELNGVSLEVDDALAQPHDGDAGMAGATALRYMLLAALCHLHDSVEAVGAVRIEADGDAGLHLLATPRIGAAAAPVPEAHQRAPRSLAIDAIALQSLADDLGYAVHVAPDSVRLALAPV